MVRRDARSVAGHHTSEVQAHHQNTDCSLSASNGMSTGLREAPATAYAGAVRDVLPERGALARLLPLVVRDADGDDCPANWKLFTKSLSERA